MRFFYENLPSVVNSLGLSLDIFGALLIWRFGLPMEISRTGATHLITDECDEAEIQAAKRFDRWSSVGFALLVAGFLLQILSNWIR